jgi:tRNA1(Val) A37 N6-methylase TrmN6
VTAAKADNIPHIEAETRVDAMLGHRLQLRQPQRGYRAGLDAALLAAAVELQPGERALEAGCGAGAALLQATARHPGAALVGVERDPAALALAQANIGANHLGDRVSAVPGDVAGRFADLGLAPFDAAFANPPFFDDPQALRPPDPSRRGAWIADDGLEAWCGFLVKAVREGGRITVIHRADRLADLLAMLAPKAGSFRVRPVHPFADAPAKRVLLRAVKTGKAPLVLLPPLVLRERDATGHRAEVDALFRGERALDWD